MEHFFWGYLFSQLNHAAVLAKRDLQLEEIFFHKLNGAQKPIGNRHLAEGHKWVNGDTTYQACIQMLPACCMSSGVSLLNSQPLISDCAGAFLT